MPHLTELQSEHAEDLQMILGEIDRLANTTTELLEFARPDKHDGNNAALSTATGTTLRLLSQLARQQGVTLDVQLADDLPAAQASPTAVREIVFNLVGNAIEAAGSGGRVTLACEHDEAGLQIEVCDDGPGIADDVRPRIFEPFVTTKTSGSGLGLHVVARRVRESGGTIDCESPPGGGTRFRVRLPLASG